MIHLPISNMDILRMAREIIESEEWYYYLEKDATSYENTLDDLEVIYNKLHELIKHE